MRGGEWGYKVLRVGFVNWVVRLAEMEAAGRAPAPT